MPVTHILRVNTSEFILCLLLMYEPYLDPEEMPMTAEWHEEREYRLRCHLDWVQSLEEADDLNKAIRFCRGASHQ